MKPKKHLIVVGGPTASGKTKMAIQLAQHYNTVILSADSRQFYQEMSIGTAKPEAAELAMAPHYFIDSHSIEQEYSVGDYEQEALTLLDQLYQKHEVVILTGGSGLYINALCQGLDQFPAVPTEIRDRLENIYETEGIATLQSMLEAADPRYAQQVDLHNPRRLLRALSIFEASGKPYSWFLQQKQTERFFQPIYIQMNWDRPILYERINRRVDLMIEAGLLDEVKTLKAHQGRPALATVGYQEIFNFFNGKYDWPTAIELIKRNSRRYAKRQMTWMRRDGFWKQFRHDALEEIIQYVDWCRAGHYQLTTSYSSDKSKQLLSFKQEAQTIAGLDLQVAKYFDWAQIRVAQNEQALHFLVGEWLERSTFSTHYLFSSSSLELFIEHFSFLPIEESKRIPNHLVDQWPPGMICYRKEAEE